MYHALFMLRLVSYMPVIQTPIQVLVTEVRYKVTVFLNKHYEAQFYHKLF